MQIPTATIWRSWSGSKVHHHVHFPTMRNPCTTNIPSQSSPACVCVCASNAGTKTPNEERSINIVRSHHNNNNKCLHRSFAHTDTWAATFRMPAACMPPRARIYYTCTLCIFTVFEHAASNTGAICLTSKIAKRSKTMRRCAPRRRRRRYTIATRRSCVIIFAHARAMLTLQFVGMSRAMKSCNIVHAIWVHSQASAWQATAMLPCRSVCRCNTGVRRTGVGAESR